jgi:hypothetical protein
MLRLPPITARTVLASAYRRADLAIVKEGEAGRKVADLCRTHGSPEQSTTVGKPRAVARSSSEIAAAEACRG